MNMYCFNKVLGHFYLSRDSGHGDAVNISSSAAELYASNFWAYTWFSLSVVSFLRILKSSSYIQLGHGAVFSFFLLLKNDITRSRKKPIEIRLRLKLKWID